MSTTTSRRTRPRLAASPMAYAYVPLTLAPLEQLAQAFADLHDIGFTAVRSDVPQELPLDDYAHWLDTYDLSPATGIFAATFDGEEELAHVLERARRTAAQHTELGLDRVMLLADPVPARRARPAVGADFDAARLDRVVEEIGTVARTLAAEGLRPLLHPRVSGLVETEREVRAVLDTLGPDVIGFGPDTGHLRWAGMDPVAMVTRYAERVGAVHLSDVYGDYAQPTRRGRGKSYDELVATCRVWAEPGSGVVDLNGVLRALPASFDGDLVVEIERASIFSVYEAYRTAHEWAAQAPVPVGV
ncbi:sugar phosphate isomerase/epimerase family protein [Georgenia subflava]|uniref:TIM barrel protein n=1 Tax=Georgenia subflava TaxID=1622177 RepID=A0A6N7EL89_9MICO|nr:sugar phosphate isomerase/epimerase [Georgenia subflava]MPV36896.1 TIM barrel protein [Georgenia subflava]